MRGVTIGGMINKSACLFGGWYVAGSHICSAARLTVVSLVKLISLSNTAPHRVRPNSLAKVSLLQTEAPCAIDPSKCGPRKSLVKQSLFEHPSKPGRKGEGTPPLRVRHHTPCA